MAKDTAVICPVCHKAQIVDKEVDQACSGTEKKAPCEHIFKATKKKAS